MDKRFLMLAILTLLILGGATNSVVADEVVIERYSGSTNLPDEIAYGSILGMVNSLYEEPESAYGFVALAMGQDMETEEGRHQTESYTSFFIDMYFELKRKKAQLSAAAFCTDVRDSRTFDEVTTDLNSLDNIRQQAAAEQLQLTLDSFNEKERSAFTAFLQERKKSISFTRLDSGNYYRSNPGRDIWVDAENLCAEYRADSTARRETQ